jgi:hypothetical protein
LCCISLLDLLSPATQADAQKGEMIFSNFNIKDDIPNRGKNFQIESIIGTIEDDILLDNRTGQIHEGMSEIMTTWLESGPTPCRVLV